MRLTYFDLRHRGEPIRYILHHGGVAFEDHRVSQEEWLAIKGTGKKGLPLWADGTFELSQSLAIARLAARIANLYPHDNIDAAKSDAVVEYILADVMAKYEPVAFGVMQGNKEEATLQMRQFSEFKTTTLNKAMDLLTKWLERNGTGFFIGDKLTWADVVAAEFFERLQSGFDPDVLNEHPRLAHVVAHVHDQPSIKEYVDRRPAVPI